MWRESSLAWAPRNRGEAFRNFSLPVDFHSASLAPAPPSLMLTFSNAWEYLPWKKWPFLKLFFYFLVLRWSSCFVMDAVLRSRLSEFYNRGYCGRQATAEGHLEASDRFLEDPVRFTFTFFHPFLSSFYSLPPFLNSWTLMAASLAKKSFGWLGPTRERAAVSQKGTFFFRSVQPPLKFTK